MHDETIKYEWHVSTLYALDYRYVVDDCWSVLLELSAELNCNSINCSQFILGIFCPRLAVLAALFKQKFPDFAIFVVPLIFGPYLVFRDNWKAPCNVVVGFACLA